MNPSNVIATAASDQFQQSATQWATAIGTVIGSVVATLLLVLPSIAALKAKYETLFKLHESNAAQIANNARAITPPATAPSSQEVPDTSNASLKLLGVPIIALLLMSAVLFSGCATTRSDVAAWWSRPATQKGVRIAEQELLASAFTFGLNIVGQEVTTGRADLASAGMSTAAFEVRKLEQSKDAGNYGAITNAIAQSGADTDQARNITSAVLSAVSIAKAEGGDPSGALEGAAKALDTLAAN